MKNYLKLVQVKITIGGTLYEVGMYIHLQFRFERLPNDMCLFYRFAPSFHDYYLYYGRSMIAMNAMNAMSMKSGT